MRPSLLLVALGLAMSVAACEKREVPPLLPQIGKDGKAAIQPALAVVVGCARMGIPRLCLGTNRLDGWRG